MKAKTKYRRRERDVERMRWTKSQPCAVAGLAHLIAPERIAADGTPILFVSSSVGRCSGPTEAHHAGAHGVGQKAPDATVVPLCVRHHRGDEGITDLRGPFRGWPPGSLRSWQDAMIFEYQRRYDARGDLDLF